MSARFAETFARRRESGLPGLIVYVTAGDPSLPASADVIRAAARGGADAIEIGVPFSDPLADGPVIQQAADRARRAGGSLRTALALVHELRGEIDVPMVLFTYLNPIARYGVDRFVGRAAEAGVDGVLVLDLPPEEAGDLRQALARKAIDVITLISPTTSDERLAAIVRNASGFLYLISRLGVTGARAELPAELRAQAARVRAQTTLPLAIGFGVSTAGHVRLVGELADAAVVGSALVALIGRHAQDPDLPARVEAFVRGLVTPAGGDAFWTPERAI
jgi:tryptophan synthase alpha chain